MKVKLYSLDRIPSKGEGYIEAMAKDFELGKGYVILQNKLDEYIIYAKSKGQPWISKKDATEALKRSKKKMCKVVQLKGIDKSILKTAKCNVL